MKGSIAVAIATGTLMVVAYGGFAIAAEGDPGDPVAAITVTAEPEAASGEEASGDAPSPDAPAEEHGLVCVLVPIESDEPAETEPTEAEPTETEPAESEPTEAEPQTIEQLLAVNEIECSGTGNERSSEVALLPRYLAHSDEFTGAEKGAAISAWAKTHANKKSDDEVDDESAEEATGDAEPSTVAPSAPGRSGDAPGQSGQRPGNGGGR